MHFKSDNSLWNYFQPGKLITGFVARAECHKVNDEFNMSRQCEKAVRAVPAACACRLRRLGEIRHHHPAIGR